MIQYFRILILIFLIPGYFSYNNKIDSYVSPDNLISIYEYITDDEVSFENYKLLTDKDI